MKRKYAEENLEIVKCCAYCEKATPLAGDEYVLCEKRGVVSLTHHCRRFAYDPLKRIPKRMPSMSASANMEIEFPDV